MQSIEKDPVFNVCIIIIVGTCFIIRFNEAQFDEVKSINNQRVRSHQNVQAKTRRENRNKKSD